MEPSSIHSKSKAFTIMAHIARVILGLIFHIMGLNGFFHFIPMPPPTGTAGEFAYGLSKAPYLFPFMSFIQVICGVLFLSGTLIPFAMLLLFPIALNILFFHLALAPSGLGLAGLIMASIIVLAVYYWPIYEPIFKIGNAWKNKSFKHI